MWPRQCEVTAQRSRVRRAITCNHVHVWIVFAIEQPGNGRNGIDVEQHLLKADAVSGEAVGLANAFAAPGGGVVVEPTTEAEEHAPVRWCLIQRCLHKTVLLHGRTVLGWCKARV